MNRITRALLPSLLVLTILATIVMAPGYARAADGPEPAKLVGRWLRTDGSYLLQLSDPGPDGQLRAAYFNPRPINVSTAAWKHEKGSLGAFVELRAPGYPGSTYTLVYDVEKDHLLGIYFHAGLQEQFAVEFTRQP